MSSRWKHKYMEIFFLNMYLLSTLNSCFVNLESYEPSSVEVEFSESIYMDYHQFIYGHGKAAYENLA